MTPLAAFAGPASAATPARARTRKESVASGINVASLPGATVFGTTPASTPETVSFILRERNDSILKVQAELGVKNYLSVSQFASTLRPDPGQHLRADQLPGGLRHQDERLRRQR